MNGGFRLVATAVMAAAAVNAPAQARDVRVVAHRGASQDYPENTVLSFRKAFDAGADAGELDVRTTADGIPIVLHDSTLHRTLGRPIPPFDILFNDIAGADAGSWKAPWFAGEPLPTPADALATVPPGLIAIDNFRLYDRERLAGEIAELYSQTAAGRPR